MGREGRRKSQDPLSGLSIGEGGAVKCSGVSLLHGAVFPSSLPTLPCVFF